MLSETLEISSFMFVVVFGVAIIGGMFFGLKLMFHLLKTINRIKPDKKYMLSINPFVFSRADYFTEEGDFYRKRSGVYLRKFILAMMVAVISWVVFHMVHG